METKPVQTGGLRQAKTHRTLASTMKFAPPDTCFDDYAKQGRVDQAARPSAARGLAKRSYPSWIAGLRYRGPDGTNRARYCRDLQIGALLKLVPEPDNAYSEHAVAVIHQGHHLGYIPERHDWIASAIAEDRRLSCSVRKVEVEGWLFRRASFVGLQVTVEDGHRLAHRELPAK
jgi:hypothetical protein